LGIIELTIGRETWLKDLGLEFAEDELEPLAEPDKDALFLGVCEFLQRVGEVELIEERGIRREVVGASAPLLVPGTRMFVRLGESALDALKKVLRLGIIFALVGLTDPGAALAGLTANIAIDLLERISRLSETEYEIVRALLDLSAKERAELAKASNLASTLGLDVQEVEQHLSTLKGKNIVKQLGESWTVVF
jgi:hypothetical protein